MEQFVEKSQTLFSRVKNSAKIEKSFFQLSWTYCCGALGSDALTLGLPRAFRSAISHSVVLCTEHVFRLPTMSTLFESSHPAWPDQMKIHIVLSFSVIGLLLKMRKKTKNNEIQNRPTHNCFVSKLFIYWSENNLGKKTNGRQSFRYLWRRTRVERIFKNIQNCKTIEIPNHHLLHTHTHFLCDKQTDLHSVRQLACTSSLSRLRNFEVFIFLRLTWLISAYF